jgi:hypothetical protein
VGNDNVRTTSSMGILKGLDQLQPPPQQAHKKQTIDDLDVTDAGDDDGDSY